MTLKCIGNTCTFCQLLILGIGILYAMCSLDFFDNKFKLKELSCVYGYPIYEITYLKYNEY